MENGAAKASQPNSVLVYSLSWLPGQVDGVAVRMMAQVKELASRGVKVTLLTPSYELPGQAPSDKPNHTKVEGVEHILLDTMPMPVYEKNYCAALTLKNFFTLTSAIRRVKPDVVHFTQCASMVMFAAACLFCDVPLLVSMHTDVTAIATRDEGFCSKVGGKRRAAFLGWLAIFFTNMGYRVAAWLGAVFFTVSKQARLILHDSGVSDASIFSVAWGPMVDRSTFRIDLPEAEVAETRQRLTFGIPNAYLMVYLGRVTAEKDVQFLVDALKRAPENVVLALVGPGSLVAELSSMHGKEHRLYCTGEYVDRAQAALVLRAADCCASASVMETVGFTAMEALSCGTPMLAANAQGFADHLSHGKNARLFTPGDKASFDKELAELMATKREGDWSAESLRASMEHASLPACTDRSLRAYEFASRRPRRSSLRFVAAMGLFLFNVFLFQVPPTLFRLSQKLIS